MSIYDYFAHCRDAEEIKREYRRLCKQWHPDLGAQIADEIERRTKKMQEINVAYAQASAVYRHEDIRQRARQYNKPEPTPQDYADADATDERIREAIEKIVVLEGLDIEICGLWVWVSGTQKRGTSVANDHALDVLMQTGFKYSGGKKKWHFAGVPAGGYRKFTMEQIRQRYGSKKVESKPKEKENA